MCGLVGVMGEITIQEEKIFKDLLVVDTLRGPHSTGIAAVSRDQKEIKIAKSVGNPFDLQDLGTYRSVFQGFSSVLLGHNRYATIGKVSRANAHPFEFEGLVGMHNGTIRNKTKLPEYNSFGTDSEAVYYNFDQFGHDEVVPELEGAWAFVWYDKYFQTLNFLRNKERPLYYVYSEDKKTMFFASEVGMLYFVLGRHDYKHGKAYITSEDMWYEWVVPTSTTETIASPYKEVLKGKEITVSNKSVSKYYHGPHSNKNNKSNSQRSKASDDYNIYFETNKNLFKFRVNKNSPGPMPESLKQDFSTRQKAEDAVAAYVRDRDKNLPAVDDSPKKISDLFKNTAGDDKKKASESTEESDELTYEVDGMVLTYEDFEEITSDGCYACRENVEFGKDRIHVIAGNHFLCEECYGFMDNNGWLGMINHIVC